MAALFAGTAMMAAGSLGTQTEQNFDGEVPQAIHLEYLLFLPSTSNEDPHRRWPLILYLHGGSLRGDDVNKLRTLGLPHRLDQDRQFPFVLVSTVCPQGEVCTYEDSLRHVVGQG